MKRILKVILAIALLAGKQSTAQENASLSDTASFMYMADPTIYYKDGKYYLYGTYDIDNSKGIKIYISQQPGIFKESNSRLALRKADAYGTANFWAPQIWQQGKRFYMAYVANEHIGIAESTTPIGPFTGKATPLITDRKTIDPFIFKDNDGKLYLFHVEFSNGNKIYVAQLKNDLSGIYPETDVLCLEALDPWEMKMEHVIEGPTVVKHKDYYYLLYSANHFKSKNYAVGYAISKSIYGPWVRGKNNPILSMDATGLPGTGHGDLFKDEKEKLHYVFHTHNSNSTIAPRKTAIVDLHFETSSNGEPDILIMDQHNVHYIRRTK